MQNRDNFKPQKPQLSVSLKQRGDTTGATRKYVLSVWVGQYGPYLALAKGATEADVQMLYRMLATPSKERPWLVDVYDQNNPPQKRAPQAQQAQTLPAGYSQAPAQAPAAQPLPAGYAVAPQASATTVSAPSYNTPTTGGIRDPHEPNF